MTLCNLNFDQIISSYLFGNEIVLRKLTCFLRNHHQDSLNVRLPVGLDLENENEFF